ncbi:single-stranded-DNA-specific exonuclease RecJ [Campylobacter blaseri]|uniref:Single-stranded-DNA-specific exonuclease RecJ n=1 Tax=Campylobacter blaseri TaxID=2042961 RepID=A0A2P8R490_9BACT|nr:single-stranded-DNA-specific exonuclease RecJ [Campylobacter blaseri]PSM54777.1 single-stranded-DNA-specific exonuclease RecJ [Campylobacter blaseri]
MLGKKEIKEILEKRFEKDIHTKISEIPLPCDLKDAYRAAERIKTAINKNERIAVVGDYDVDGIVSSVIVADFFDLMGVDFFVKIPNRFSDGYGLNAEILRDLKDFDLIITVDNGISAIEAAEVCIKNGIDLIITDHHMPTEVLPRAYAIVNPKQKDCSFPDIEICGAEVAWYLIGALKDICGVEYDMSLSLDLLVIAIIADMMELRDMNRVLVRAGIKKLNSSKRPCFYAIKNYFNKAKFEFDDISFLISPLINCTGRMDDGNLSFKFLRSRNLKEAERYLNMIVSINNSRKEEEKYLYESSKLIVEDNDEIIVTWGEDWHEGVVGIVASRLCRKYKKPAIVFSVDKDRAKGSARSVGKFDILKLIASQQDILISFGGHKGAAGLVIEPDNLELFKSRINSSCFLDDLSICPYANELLGEINLAEFDLEMVEILEFFEPYGQKNPKPIFEIKDAIIRNIRFIGKEQNHIKMTIEKDGVLKEAIFFNYDVDVRVGQKVRLIVSAIKNSFRGVCNPEFIIKEIIE